MSRTPRPDHVRRTARFALRAVVAGIVLSALACSGALGSPSAPGTLHRWGVVPLRPAASAASPHGPIAGAAVTNAVASTDTLSYGGTLDGVGVITGHPKVYLVFWGSQWGSVGAPVPVQGVGTYTAFSGDPEGIAPLLQAFFAGLGTRVDGWSGGLTQYCESSATVGVGAGATSCPAGATPVGDPIGGALAGVWEDTSAAAPPSALASDLANEAERAAGHFGNTTTAANRDALYVVVSPTNTNPDGFGPTGSYCAWHDDSADTATLGSIAQTNGTVAFVNLPYLPDVGTLCGADAVNRTTGANDGVTIVAGHEYAEWLTDPIPGGGWYNTTTGDEAADECAWISSGQGAMTDIALNTGLFPVQSIWSNANDACETTGIAFTTASPDQLGTVGTPLASLSELAIDPFPDGSLTYSASGLPAGVTIDPATGQIGGTPTATATDAPSIVTATDGAGVASAITLLWTIAPAPVVPAPGGPSSVSIAAPVRVVSLQTAYASIGVAAADTRAQTLTFTAQGLPSGLAINPRTGLISGRVTAAPGTYRPIITATDTTGARSHRTVVWIIQSPVTIAPIPTQSSVRGRRVALRVYARELIGHRVMRYAATGLPTGVHIDARTGVITGRIAGRRGVHRVTVVVTDSGGARISRGFTWRVT